MAINTARQDLEIAGIDTSSMSDQQLLDLMWDPATKKYEPTEAVQALRYQNETGIEITGRANGAGDITTSNGNIDLMGAPNNPNYYNADSFKKQIENHATKPGVDQTAIDMTNVPANQREDVINYINKLNDQGENIVVFGI